MSGDEVLVVGSGIAGIACAGQLALAGVPVQVRDRGRQVGGRMAVRLVGGRPVDVGASYLTTRDPGFRQLVSDWLRRGLLHAWTDTFHTATPAGLGPTTTGPVRYGTPAGLSSLVADLATGLLVEQESEVAEVSIGPSADGEEYAAVVLAMPDPQARDLVDDRLDGVLAVLEGPEWEPTLVLYAGWAERSWPAFDGAFVSSSEVLSWVADDGRRRGDRAPVLVAHSTGPFAALHSDDPEAALGPMLTAVRDMLGIPSTPNWARVHCWSLSRPLRPRAAPFFLGTGMVAVCGDGWGSPRIETAYLSGHALGRELAERLTGRAGGGPRPDG
jgi:renalase